MHVIGVIAAIAIVASALIQRARKRREARDIVRYGISAELLHRRLKSEADLLLYDVREPLDLLAHPEIIKGAKWLSPHRVPVQAVEISKEREIVIYGTAHSYETYRRIVRSALSHGFTRIRILDGGLEAWKAKGYEVTPYDAPFRLDTAR